jgi:hypothetical protein
MEQVGQYVFTMITELCSSETPSLPSLVLLEIDTSKRRQKCEGPTIATIPNYITLLSQAAILSDSRSLLGDEMARRRTQWGRHRWIFVRTERGGGK